jgi:thiol-disulfide isomerase/thioredoxin
MKTLSIALAFAVLSGTALRAQDTGIKVGSDAPAAAVEMLDGRKVDLATMYGEKPVVLEFWATWCPLCRKLEPSLQAARDKHGAMINFVSVGVPSNQSPEKQKEYAEKQKLSGAFVFDRDGAAMRAFSVPHTSYIVVIDKHKKVVYTGVGAEQDIEAALAKINP